MLTFEIPPAIVVPDDIAKLDTGGADAFNAESARLQENAGVNPELCLKFLMVVSQERATRRDFFNGIIVRRWITPMNGNYRWHDAKYHEKALRELHPSSVAIIMKAAEFGLDLENKGEIEEAKNAADAIDNYVDVVTMESGYPDLIEAAFLDTSLAPDYSVQREHSERMNNTAMAAGEPSSAMQLLMSVFSELSQYALE
jgi:hypothetical protein